jgi:hypothetical protein
MENLVFLFVGFDQVMGVFLLLGDGIIVFASSKDQRERLWQSCVGTLEVSTLWTGLPMRFHPGYSLVREEKITTYIYGNALQNPSAYRWI